jgi:hypothetical protein
MERKEGPPHVVRPFPPSLNVSCTKTSTVQKLISRTRKRRRADMTIDALLSDRPSVAGASG